MKKNRFNTPSYRFRIGSNIRKWRNIKDIKQKDLAAALQISEAAVSNIENDLTNITIGLLEQLSIALNISVEQLLYDPQERFRIPVTAGDAINDNKQQQLDREFIHAIISSMEKKDEQLQAIMQHFLNTMNRLMQQDKLVLNEPGALWDIKKTVT